MATSTLGFHRINQVLSRASSGIAAQVVPFATIYVTLTSTGGGATIYSDPGLSISITGSVVTADEVGNYDYYIPIGYNVTELISDAVGSVTTVSNVVQNGALAGSLTTTNATSDTVSISGLTSSSHVSLTPTNATAATMYAAGGTYVSAKTSGSLTVTHPATAGATFDILATSY